MYLVSIFAFSLAALIGLFMAVAHFRGVESGKAVGFAHGFFALSGIALLASGLYRVRADWGWWVLASFGVVAAGGLYLGSRQLRGKPWPGAVIVAHGGLALLTIGALGVWLGTRDQAPSRGGDVPAQTTENESIPVEELQERQEAGEFPVPEDRRPAEPAVPGSPAE